MFKIKVIDYLLVASYFELLMIKAIGIDDLYLFSIIIAMDGYRRVILSGESRIKSPIVIFIFLVCCSVILGALNYGMSYKSFFAVTLTTGVVLRVSCLTEETKRRFFTNLGSVSSLLSVALIVFSPFLMKSGRLFLNVNEPSHIAIALAPGLVILLFRKNYWKALPIIVVLYLTMAVTVLFGFLVIFSIWLLSKIYLLRLKDLFIGIVGLIFIVGFFTTFINYFPEINYRITDTIKYVRLFDIEHSNRTLFSFASHLMTFKILILENNLLGLGYFNYAKYIEQPLVLEYYNSNPYMWSRIINEKSGHSILVRSINEFGFLIIPLILLIMSRMHCLKNQYGNDIFYVVLLVFSIRALKLAGYLDLGFLTFLAIVLSSRKIGTKNWS